MPWSSLICTKGLWCKNTACCMPNFKVSVSSSGIHKLIWVPAFPGCLGLELTSHCIWVKKGIKTYQHENLREVWLLAVMLLIRFLTATSWSLILVFCVWLKFRLRRGAPYIMWVDPCLQSGAHGFSHSVSEQQWCVPAHALQVELCALTSKTTTKSIKSALWSQV